MVGGEISGWNPYKKGVIKQGWRFWAYYRIGMSYIWRYCHTHSRSGNTWHHKGYIWPKVKYNLYPGFFTRCPFFTENDRWQ